VPASTAAECVTTLTRTAAVRPRTPGGAERDPQAFILRVVQTLTQDETVEDLRDMVASALLRIAGRLSVESQHFMALYLL
jgi:hypothetical protein